MVKFGYTNLFYYILQKKNFYEKFWKCNILLLYGEKEVYIIKEKGRFVNVCATNSFLKSYILRLYIYI